MIVIQEYEALNKMVSLSLSFVLANRITRNLTNGIVANCFEGEPLGDHDV